MQEVGQDKLQDTLRQMLLIRNFETRAESAYLQGKVGGFFHSYMGQEAIQAAAVLALGVKQWWVTSYRCHALALLLGATPRELMAELFGRETGNALGRGGSMHFFTERLLGGFGIVGGQVPIATGAAFAIRYRKAVAELQREETGDVAVCFLGDGAVAQGAFHESLNLASLWNLPCIYVVENNQWGMGTHVGRALCMKPIAEQIAPAYNMKSYTLDGMDFVNCYAAFAQMGAEVARTGRPVLVEAVTERFRGHSISDPAAYRSKESLATCMQRDPLVVLRKQMERMGWMTTERYEALDAAQRTIAVDALDFADKSPWPNPLTLEDDVFAP
jgi:pyruvate dehydrogenase E1 component alpha subunit